VINATLRPLYLRGRPDTRFIGGWVGPGAVLHVAENLIPTGFQIPALQSVASRCTDYTVPALQSVASRCTDYTVPALQSVASRCTDYAVPALQSVASRCTDYAVPAHRVVFLGF
jgi:hypothetical protein